jgi:hypothetical protein
MLQWQINEDPTKSAYCVVGSFYENNSIYSNKITESEFNNS